MADGVAGYWYPRWLFERALALLYLTAFACAACRFVPLLGERGLLPVSRFIGVVPFRASPGLFYLSATDTTFRGAAWVGVVLSAALLTGILQQSALAAGAVWTILW